MRKNELIGPDAAEFYQDNSCSPTDFRIVVSAMNWEKALLKCIPSAMSENDTPCIDDGWPRAA